METPRSTAGAPNRLRSLMQPSLRRAIRVRQTDSTRRRGCGPVAKAWLALLVRIRGYPPHSWSSLCPMPGTNTSALREVASLWLASSDEAHVGDKRGRDAIATVAGQRDCIDPRTSTHTLGANAAPPPTRATAAGCRDTATSKQVQSDKGRAAASRLPPRLNLLVGNVLRLAVAAPAVDV